MHPVWYSLFAPLAGGLICLLVGRRLGRAATGWLAAGAIALAFGASALTAAQPPEQPDQILFRWLQLGPVAVNFGAYVDTLSLTMLLTVTGVAFLIHVYSIGYMAEEPEYARYFGYLNLFVAAMVMLVLADNFALLLLGWGGVGFASCMLIGFHSERQSALVAARKAFVLNTVGDVGLMLAVVMLVQAGVVSYTDVFSQALAVPHLSLAAVGLLVAAYAKSAQFPLHTWLPDAMEGPTPVSALIHAATMVTAGVYLVVRCEPIFEVVPEVQVWVVAFGLLSAALAATCAVAQTDLKRVLAYSTMSQLGFMFMAAGVGAGAIAIFHLVTHAFFKALMFLCAGTVIHALHGEQNMFRMGGLARAPELRGAHFGFAMGALALAGFPLLAGFWSKELILDAIHLFDPTGYIWIGGLMTSLFTACYIGRAYFLVFHAAPPHEHEHLHAPGLSMAVPVWVLTLLTLAGGYALQDRIVTNLGIYLADPILHLELGHAVLISLATFVPGLGLAILLIPPGKPGKAQTGPLYRWLASGWGLDHLQALLIANPIRLLADLFGRQVEKVTSGELPEGVGQTMVRSGSELGLSQTGLLRNYAFMLLVALLSVLVFALWSAGRAF